LLMGLVDKKLLTHQLRSSLERDPQARFHLNKPDQKIDM